MDDATGLPKARTKQLAGSIRTHPGPPSELGGEGLASHARNIFQISEHGKRIAAPGLSNTEGNTDE